VSPAIRAALCVALTAWTLLLVVTLLAPSAAGPSWLVETVAAGLERIGVPDSLTDGARVEFALNVVAFVPLSLLGTPLWPRLTWRDWTAVGFAASFLVEAAQAVVLDARSATHADVVANTLGTLVGAVLGLGLAALLASRGPESGSERGADLPDRDASAEELQPPG
jgi:glycopeptide antibiotics resistance protein